MYCRSNRPAHPQHPRTGIEDNLWDTTKGKPMTTMIERHVRMGGELGRPIATAEQARKMLKIGITYRSTEETLANLGLPPTAGPATWDSWRTKQMEGTTLQRRADAGTSTPASGRTNWRFPAK
ncbi:MAG TPA: 3-keto-5-aminohexanoate cleavage protein [Candidatus Sulfotelmatobacter sp.]